MSLFLCGVGKTSSLASILGLIFFFHILVIRECWVLTQSRIPLKLVPGDVKIVAHSISSYEQTKKNRVCCFLVLQVLSFSAGSVFPY